METEKKKARKLTIIWAIVWAITYDGSLLLFKHSHLNTFLAMAIAVVPIAAFVIYVYRYIKSIATMDEVKQRIHFEAAVIGFALGLLLLMILCLLDVANVLNYDYFGYGFVLLYCMVFYYIGYFISKRKYTA
ncbi:hypothetical protein [uncultured Mucilaginibacter sp.]|uniref:hypothetical protein n=1 Tax=uncultured Mucilaginibacter sp. TaxID=797541 RepID=UPI0025DBB079|nr:hypothetical protein [uncultured Mucilaginibacter sp.]